MTNATAERVDTWDMVVVHRWFRREFALMPTLVSGVAGGNTAKAHEVGTWIADLIDALHHHHTGEDDLLWPRLLQRVELSADLVHRMESQHERVSELLDTAVRLLPAWQGGAEIDVRTRLADTLSEVAALLDAHLAEEEREVLPLVSEHITVAEWIEVGDRGRASMPKEPKKALLMLAAILHDATPEERTRFLKDLPIPPRVLYRLVGSRLYRNEINKLRSAA